VDFDSDVSLISRVSSPRLIFRHLRPNLQTLLIPGCLTIEIDTITFSSFSSSVTPVLESLACCFVSPMIPTPKVISPQSVLTSYVSESAGHLVRKWKVVLTSRPWQKIRTIELDGKTVKLQIVRLRGTPNIRGKANGSYSGTPLARNVSVPSPLLTTVVLTEFAWFTMSPTWTPSTMWSSGSRRLTDTPPRVSTSCLLATRAIWKTRRSWSTLLPRYDKLCKSFMGVSRWNRPLIFLCCTGVRRQPRNSFPRDLGQERVECWAGILDNGKTDQGAYGNSHCQQQAYRASWPGPRCPVWIGRWLLLDDTMFSVVRCFDLAQCYIMNEGLQAAWYLIGRLVRPFDTRHSPGLRRCFSTELAIVTISAVGSLLPSLCFRRPSFYPHFCVCFCNYRWFLRSHDFLASSPTYSLAHHSPCVFFFPLYFLFSLL